MRGWYGRLRRHRGWTRLFWVGILLLAWEVGVKVSGISPLLIPPVEDVAAALWENLFHGELFLQAGVSLGLIALGLAASAALALLLTLLCEVSPVLRDGIDSLCAIAHPLPGVALLPLVILWFGAGTWAAAALVVHSCLWPLLLNLRAGFGAVPPVLRDVGRNLSMGRAALGLQILLPASRSYLLSGAKIGWARAWRALISAEMIFGAIGGPGGMGWFLFKQRSFMNTAGLFAGVAVVVAAGMAMDALFDRLAGRRSAAEWETGRRRGRGVPPRCRRRRPAACSPTEGAAPAGGGGEPGL